MENFWMLFLSLTTDMEDGVAVDKKKKMQKFAKELLIQWKHNQSYLREATAEVIKLLRFILIFPTIYTQVKIIATWLKKKTY